MTREDYIEILKQYKEKPTLINEISSVEEAVWLDEALDAAIKALEQESVLDKIRAEIDGIEINGQVDEHTMFIRTGEQVKQMAIDIIDKYRRESEDKG